MHIIHGTHDKLIPFSSSVKLAKIKPELTRLWPVVGGGHKNLNTFESYHIMLSDIIEARKKEIDLDTTSHHVKHSSKS